MPDYKPANEKALLIDLILNNPQLRPTKILQLFGLKQALNVMSPRELRTMFAKYNKKSWYKLMGDANKVKLPIAQQPLEVVRNEIPKFNPLKIMFCFSK